MKLINKIALTLIGAIIGYALVGALITSIMPLLAFISIVLFINTTIL